MIWNYLLKKLVWYYVWFVMQFSAFVFRC